MLPHAAWVKESRKEGGVTKQSHKLTYTHTDVLTHTVLHIPEVGLTLQ